MIGKLVDPRDRAGALEAIVDAGLKLLTLESHGAGRGQGRRIGNRGHRRGDGAPGLDLPDYVLDNQELLEGFALEAFEQAAAANLPPVLSEAVYRERPGSARIAGGEDLLGDAAAAAPQALQEVRAARSRSASAPTWPTRSSRSKGRSPTTSRISWAWTTAAEVEAEVAALRDAAGHDAADIARDESEAAGGTGRRDACAERRAAPSAHAEGRRPPARRAADGSGHAVAARIVAVSASGSGFYRLSIPGRTAADRGRRRTAGRTRGGRAVCASALDVRQERNPGVRLPERGQGTAAVRAAASCIASRRIVAAGFQSYVERRLGPIAARRAAWSACSIVQAGLAARRLAAVPPSDDCRRTPRRPSPAACRSRSSALSREFARSQSQRFIDGGRRHRRRDHPDVHHRAAGRSGADRQGVAARRTDRRRWRRHRGGSSAEVRVDVAPGYRVTEPLALVHAQLARQVNHWVTRPSLSRSRTTSRRRKRGTGSSAIWACRCARISTASSPSCASKPMSWPPRCERRQSPTALARAPAAPASLPADSSCGPRPRSTSSPTPSTRARVRARPGCCGRATSSRTAAWRCCSTSSGTPLAVVLTYVDKGLGASILKAGLRLWDGGAESPVAAIKIVRHNLLRPTALIHEAGHQVAHIVGWNRELAGRWPTACATRRTLSPRSWSSWASEIAADAFAFVHTGYASVAALHDVLAGERAFVFQHSAGDPHPICYLRVLLGVETCRYFYGAGPWDALAASWIAGAIQPGPRARGRGPARTVGAAAAAIVRLTLDTPQRAFRGRSLRAVVQPERVSRRSSAPSSSASGRRSTRPCTGCGRNVCD